MDTRPVSSERLAESVIAVPPLARDSHYKIALEENRKIVRYLEAAKINILLYGGNAVLYHVQLSEYAQLLQTLVEVADAGTLVIPAVGPAYGTMLDQAEVLADFDFPTVMILPQRDIADPQGIATGIQRFADRYGKPVVLYLKHDRWLPPDLVGKLYRDGLLSWIKYAVVRDDASHDDYLREVLDEVPGSLVVSGIGEQPAIIHMRDFGIVGFTSGCVCVQPAKSLQMLRAIQAGDYQRAESIRQDFTELEDLRNEINPIRVLHRAVELAGIAETGPILPLLGELSSSHTDAISRAAIELKQQA